MSCSAGSSSESLVKLQSSCQPGLHSFENPIGTEKFTSKFTGINCLEASAPHHVGLSMKLLTT